MRMFIALSLLSVVISTARAADEKPKTTVTLPGAVADVCAGGGGKFLILHLPQQRQLAIFDAHAGKIVKMLPLADDHVLMAAGRSKLLVVLPDKNRVERWSLTSFEKETSAAMPIAGTVHGMGMGSASDGPLVFGAVESPGPPGRTTAFLDIATLREIKYHETTTDKKSLAGTKNSGENVRVSADGHVIGMWKEHTSPSGLHTIILSGSNCQDIYQHKGVGHVVPGPDGQTIYTGEGMYTSAGKKLGGDAIGPFAVPSVHGNYYLTLPFALPRAASSKTKVETPKPGVSIHLVGDARPLTTLTDVDGLGGNVTGRSSSGLTIDKRVLLIPSANVLVTIPDNGDRLHLYHVDLEAALEKAGIDYLVVTSEPVTTIAKGQNYTYQVAVKSKKGSVKYKLESGPKGMKISSDGKITWTVPDNVTEPEVDVVVSVGDKSGQEAYHSFRIAVEGVARKDMEIASAGKGEKPSGAKTPPARPDTEPAKPGKPDAQDKSDANEDPPVTNGDTLPKKAKVDQELTYNLASGLKGAASFYGTAGPPGLKLTEDGKISWKPTKEQVGLHELRLQFKHAGKSEIRTYKILVEDDRTVVSGSRPELALPNGATFPSKAVVGKEFSFNLASGIGKVSFTGMGGPKGLKVDSAGKVTWTPEVGMIGSYQLRVQANFTGAGRQENFNYTIIVDGNPGRPITTLPLTTPSGWVMLPDNVTLIVSLADTAQLVYVDTVAGKELKRVEMDFPPASLALQGKTLYAAAKGSSMVYALDPQTGKQQKEFAVGSDAVARLACHPSKGLLYASTTKFTVYAIEPESGKATLTDAKGYFLAVDPVAGEFVYTGIQPMNKDEFIWKEDSSGKVTIFWDRWGTRGMLMKYSVMGKGLLQKSSQNNAAVNGWDMHLTPDGKRLMMVGGGGWRPKDEGSGGGYVVAVYNTSNLEAMVGQAPLGLTIAFHPVLNLGVTNNHGKELIVFNGKSLVKKETITLCKQEERRPSVLTFGAKGTKVVVWNGPNAVQGQGLQLVPLTLSKEDRDALEKEYGPLPPASVKTE